MKIQASTSDAIDKTSNRIREVQQALLAWYAANRSDLPWRRGADPYAVLVSEFMLQQTQRERVAPKFIAFMERFPSLQALAAVPAAEVIRAWAGLGYNSRALRLHQIAKSVANGNGEIPDEIEALQSLPGIGAYTAGAVACFGFGQQRAFVDTNIRRVLRRVLRGDAYPTPAPKLDAELARAALPPGRAVEWNSALMDLGALVCKATGPRCTICPLQKLCSAAVHFSPEATRQPGMRMAAEARAPYRVRGAGSDLRSQPFRSTDRYLRGRIVDALRCLSPTAAITLPALSAAVTGIGLPAQDERVVVLVERLLKEGMVVSVQAEDGTSCYRLPE